MSGSQVATSSSELQYAIYGFNAISLTNWTTSAASVIAAGSQVEVAGAFFTFSGNDTNDATSFSSITTGQTAYLQLVPSGTAGSQIVTSSWTSTAPTYRTDRFGYYASAASATRYVAGCIKTGATSYEYKFLLQNLGNTQINQDIAFRGANSHSGIETHTGNESFSSISIATTLTVATSATATFNTSLIASGGITENSVILKRKIINIGDWNMDSTSLVNISHGLDSTKIRSFSAIVRQDSPSNTILDIRTAIDSLGNEAASPAGDIYLTGTATAFTITRRSSYYFDTNNFDQTSYNRGWIFVQYEV
jgi:hypothetical protein